MPIALYPRSWFVYEGVFKPSSKVNSFFPDLGAELPETSYPT